MLQNTNVAPRSESDSSGSDSNNNSIVIERMIEETQSAPHEDVQQILERGEPRRAKSTTGMRMTVSEAEEHRPQALRNVQNFSNLPGKITSMQEVSPHEIVFYPGEFDGEIIWHARQHRKHRYPLVEAHNDSSTVAPASWNILTVEPGNISWWVAHVFTWGSILWIINGAYLMWPTGNDKADMLITTISGFFGGFMFEFGAYFAVLEAINPRRTLEFGYRVANKIGKKKSQQPGDKKNLVHLMSYSENDPQEEEPTREWKWFALEWNDAGAQAASAQFLGASLFTVAVILSLPKVGAESILVSNFIVADIFIWGFQVVGSCGFIYAGIVLMLETQYVWYVPNFGAIGWWVNFFNFIGGVGFFFCAVFGLLDDVNGRTICCQYYGTILSTFWGSIAFLLGSILLVIEVANKHPMPPPSFLVRFSRPLEAHDQQSLHHDVKEDNVSPV